MRRITWLNQNIQRVIGTITLLLLFISLSTSVCAAEKAHALVIEGRSETHTSSDEYKKLLIDNNKFYSFEDVYTYKYDVDGKGTLLGSGGRKGKLEAAFKKAYGNSKSSDVLFFIYQGHGGDKGFQVSGNVLYSIFGENTMSYADLLKNLLKYKSKHIFIFIDACHSGNIHNAYLDLYASQQRKISLFYSCKAKENTYSLNKKNSDKWDSSNMIITIEQCLNKSSGEVTTAKLGAYLKNNGLKYSKEVYKYLHNNNSKSNYTIEHPNYATGDSTFVVFSKTTPKKAKIALSPQKLDIQVGSSHTLKATVTGGASKTVKWKTSNSAVATVSSKGVVKGIKKGKATITATANGKSAECYVTVSPDSVIVVPITEPTIKLDITSVNIETGKTVQLKATVTGSSKTVTWTSSNQSIATVDSNGVVEGIKVGTATITAKANGTTAKCTVTVTKKKTTSSGVKAVSCQSSHTAIIKNDGSLWMCGNNDYGQLGDGTNINKCKPVKIMSDVESVSAGFFYTAILKTDGTLWMCGANGYGQLGDGSNIDKNKPVKIMSGVKSVNAGRYYATAILKTDGTLWMCGYNGYGQLGDGTSTDKNKPIKIMSGVKAVSSGNSYTAILKTDGTLWMCGKNLYGQYGDGTNTGTYEPVKIMSGVKSVSTGECHTAILKTDGTLWMCGNAEYGKLGDGTGTNKNKPVKIMSDVSSVSAGGQHTAILKTDGTLWMCGCNDCGGLGDGTKTNKYYPVEIMSGVTLVSAGAGHTAIVKTDGTLWMCGYNYYGELGDGTTVDKTTPVKIF